MRDLTKLHAYNMKSDFEKPLAALVAVNGQSEALAMSDGPETKGQQGTHYVNFTLILALNTSCALMTSALKAFVM